MLENL